MEGNVQAEQKMEQGARGIRYGINVFQHGNLEEDLPAFDDVKKGLIMISIGFASTIELSKIIQIIPFSNEVPIRMMSLFELLNP